jgi:MFS family permease
LYLIGFGLFGFVEIFVLFVVAMLIITAGEMIVIPVGQALVARFAPKDKRGRYMAIYGLSWTIPAAIGPWAAGIVLDNYNPNLVWYLAGVFCAISVAGFYLLYLRSRDRFKMPAAEQAGFSAST